MDSFSVPFHFTAAFLAAASAAGSVWAIFVRPVPGAGLRRIFFGLGWASAGATAVIHGGFFAPSDSNPALAAARAGGYVLVLLSIPWRGEPTAARQPLLFALAAFIAAEFAFFMPGAGASEASSPGWWIAHSLQLLGGVILWVWIWRALSGSIQVRFIATFVVLLLIVVVAISSAMTQVFASNLRTEALAEAAREADLQRRRLRDQEAVAVRDAGQIARTDEVRRLMSERSDSLGDVATGLQGPGGLFEAADFLGFVDADGALVGISSQPSGDQRDGEPLFDEAEAVALIGTDVVASALRGVQAGSLDLIGTDDIGVVGAFPIFNPVGVDPPGAQLSVAGAVVLGQLIDPQYLESLSSGSRQQFSVVSPDVVISSTFQRPETLLEADLRQVFEFGDQISKELQIDGETYFNSFVSLERSDGKVVGALVISQPSEVLLLTQRGVGRVLFALALAAAVAALLLAFVSGRRISRPIVDLTEAAEKVRTGDLETRVGIAGPDEIAALGRAFNEMTGSISQLTGDLRSAAERLDTILQSMTDGVVAADADGRIITVNREAERILGITAKRAEGKRLQEVLVVTDEHGAAIDLPIFKLRQGSTRGEFSAQEGNKRIPVVVTSSPFRAEAGEVFGAVAVVRDLTAEVAVEKMKTEFLSNISHELRTPLTPIKGWTDLLKRKALPRADQLKMLEGIASSTRRLERIVEMLVDVSSIEAGRLVPRTGPVNLERATAEMVEKWKEEAPQHRFERRGFRKVPLIQADERLLPRAIDELIDNAVKFSPEGGKISLIAEVEQSKNGSTAYISIKDEGIGIDQGRLDEMFADFVQADASATRQFGGLGLGLGFVRRIAEAHGGTLEASSDPQKGSTFTIVLPVTPTEIPEDSSSRRRTKRSISPKRGR